MVTYLGQVVKPEKLEIKDCAIKSLKAASPPRSKREQRSFFGLCNVYRRIAQKFAHIARPLNNMLQKESPENFDNLSAEQLGSLGNVIKILTSAPILYLPYLH